MLPTVNPMTSARRMPPGSGMRWVSVGVPQLAGVRSLAGFERLAQVLDRRGLPRGRPAVELRQ